MIATLAALLGGILLFLAVTLLIALDNWHALPRLAGYPPPAAWPSVSILLPARNEARNLRACVSSLLRQSYPNFELLVLDDESTDATPAVLRELAAGDARLRPLAGRPLPAGWLGKHWACHQLAEQAGDDLLLFTDADTVHHPEALRDAVAALLAEDAGLLSAVPRQILGSWGERLVVPLLPWSLVSFYPQRLARRVRWPALVMAVGQFMLFRRAAYQASGGHAAVRAHVADDIALARRLVAQGGRWRLLDATARVSCRMYHGLAEAYPGFSKNLYAAFNYDALGLLAVWVWLAVAFWLPLVVVLAWLLAAVGLPVAAVGLVPLGLALAAVGLALAQWGVCAARFRMSWAVAALYPAIVGLGAVIALRSLLLTRAGRATWKGRLLPAGR
ncbi:MAG: glycosyltransferase family 2 protein [Anaerolineales bacterium]